MGAGHWDIVLLDVNMNGKVLFFKTISVRQSEKYFNYQQVPDNITLEQAAQLLQKYAAGSPSLSGH